MQPFRQFVFVAHWFTPLLASAWIIFMATRGGDGFGALVAVFVAPVAFLGLLVGPIISVSVRRIRSARTVPALYVVLTLVLWAAIILYGLAVTNSNGYDTPPSGLEVLGLPGEWNPPVSNGTMVVSVLLWAASLFALCWPTRRRVSA